MFITAFHCSKSFSQCSRVDLLDFMWMVRYALKVYRSRRWIFKFLCGLHAYLTPNQCFSKHHVTFRDAIPSYQWVTKLSTCSDCCHRNYIVSGPENNVSVQRRQAAREIIKELARLEKIIIPRTLLNVRAFSVWRLDKKSERRHSRELYYHQFTALG